MQCSMYKAIDQNRTDNAGHEWCDPRYLYGLL